MEYSYEDDEISLKDLVAKLGEFLLEIKQNLVLFIMGTGLVLGSVIGYGKLKSKEYESELRFYLKNEKLIEAANKLLPAGYGIVFTKDWVKSEILSDQFLSEVMKENNLEQRFIAIKKDWEVEESLRPSLVVSELKNAENPVVKISEDKNSPVMILTVTSADESFSDDLMKSMVLRIKSTIEREVSDKMKGGMEELGRRAGEMEGNGIIEIQNQQKLRMNKYDLEILAGLGSEFLEFQSRSLKPRIIGEMGLFKGIIIGGFLGSFLLGGFIIGRKVVRDALNS